MIINVTVTQRDIDTSRPRSPYSCAVAVAIKRAARADDVTVGSRGVCIEIGSRARYLELPEVAVDLIFAFDDPEKRKRVKPIFFQLEDIDG
jgi:non-canonical (house-cleaning) NTP pyrophosphatase